MKKSMVRQDEARFIPSSHLTIGTVEANSKRLMAFMRDAQSTKFSLDLSQVTVCDSAGLALIIEAKKLCTRYRKTFSVTSIPQSIHALAEFCGVDQIMLDNRC